MHLCFKKLSSNGSEQPQRNTVCQKCEEDEPIFLFLSPEQNWITPVNTLQAHILFWAKWLQLLTFFKTEIQSRYICAEHQQKLW